jgi:ribosome-associated protein
VKKAKASPKKKAAKKPVKAKVKKTKAKKPVARKPVKAKRSAKPVSRPAKRSVVKVATRKPVAKRAVKPAPLKAIVAPVRETPKVVHAPLVQAILTQLEDSKAEQIVTIDLVNKSTVADAMVIASGRSNRHVNAIADQVTDKLAQLGQKNVRVEGIPQCDWVVVDAGDVVVHIFRPEVRSFYNLEKLWSAPTAG